MAKRNYKSIPQLAREMGLTRDAVYKKVKRGELKAAKIGRNFAMEVDPSKYISIAQFAQAVGVSRIAVYKRIKSGQLEAIRVGRNHLIRVDHIAVTKHSRVRRRKTIELKEKVFNKVLSQQKDKHFSVPELARQLGITRDAVYKKIKRGDISASKVGRNFASNSKDNEHISIAQLAGILGISRIAVYKRVKQGQIAAIKVGRNHLIAVSYLRGYLNAEQQEKMNQLIKKQTGR